MTKRILSAILALIMSVTLLAGCSPSVTERHKAVFKHLAEDTEMITAPTPATILYEAMQEGVFSITTTDDECATTYTMYQSISKGDYKTEVVKKGENTLKRSWQLSNGHFLLTSNAYSTSAYGVELAGEGMADGCFLEAVNINPEIYHQYYLPRVKEMIERDEPIAVSVPALITLIGSQISNENISVSETKWKTAAGKDKKGILVSYDISGETAAKVWTSVYAAYNADSSTRYKQYINSIVKSCLESEGVVLPAKETNHMQSAKDSWMRQLDYIYNNSKPRIVMEVFYDEKAEIVDHAAIYISTTEGTEFVKLRVLWERRKTDSGTEYLLTYSVDGPGAMFQDITIESLWNITDTKKECGYSQVLTLRTEYETVSQTEAFSYEKDTDNFIWTTNIYNQEVVFKGTTNMSDRNVQMSVQRVEFADMSYEVALEIAATAGEPVPSAGSYVDLNVIDLNQVREIYDNIMSYIPEIAA